VGGCVRDLKLGRAPKDFDIATSAHPGEIRSLFRNCRLIGRRFRLAHIYFRGGKIIEVSTFRTNPLDLDNEEELPEDLLITRDNVFGSAEQDARRRDFTVNGLFYDIRRGEALDYVGGLRDLSNRIIRTIGNPEVRMREDPVRLLRAVRFASRLDFEIDPHTHASMEGAVPDLTRCAPARLLEEVFRLLRCGAASRSFKLLNALGALRLLLPPIAEHVERTGPDGERDLLSRLACLDAWVRKGPVDDAIIVASLLAPLLESASAERERDLGTVIDGLLEQMVLTARLPRRIAERARSLLWAQGILSGERRRKRSPGSFRQHPDYPDALRVFEIGVEATGKGSELLTRWQSGAAPLVGVPSPAGLVPDERTGRRRRRRRRGDASPGGSAPGGPGGPPPASDG
jgi:poly(A) polymerase